MMQPKKHTAIREYRHKFDCGTAGRGRFSSALSERDVTSGRHYGLPAFRYLETVITEYYCS